MSENILPENAEMQQETEPVAIERIARGAWSAQVRFVGLRSQLNLPRVVADELLARAREGGVEITVDDQGYYHDFGPNDYGSRYLPQLVQKASAAESFGPRLQPTGKVRVSRYVVHTIWEEVGV